MRRIAFALILTIASGWAAPSQAQWWGGGWAEQRRFGDGPGPVWGGPDAFEPPRFRDGVEGWRRMPWRSWIRWRRLESWRRRAAAGREAAASEAERPRVRRWLHHAEAPVSMDPTGALRLARPRVHAAMPSRVLAAAPKPRHPIVARGVEPPARPGGPALRRAVARPSPPAEEGPKGLHSQPAPLPAAGPVSAAAAPVPAAPEALQAAPADVPVAPLD